MSGVLNRPEIHKCLLGNRQGVDKPEIFLPQTWREEQLRAAGYDLRVSTNVRALNDEIFPQGYQHGEKLVLEAGDTALVLSVERFLMPWNIAGNLGLRFRYAREGLAVQTGLLVDPGYGWRKINGDWVEEGAPLHFFLLNIGSDPISISLGEEGSEVLSIQFLHMAPVPDEEREEKPPPGDIVPADALRTYREISETKEELEAERKSNNKRFRDLDAQLGELSSELRITRSASDHTVVFGTFILAVALIGVVIGGLLQWLSGDNVKDVIERLNELNPQGTVATLVTGAAILAIPLCVGVAGLCVAALYRLKLESKRKPGAGSAEG